MVTGAQAVQDISERLGMRLLPGISTLQKVVARQWALFLGANSVSRVLGAARAIVVARLLSPDDYGLLATLLVVAFYLQCLDLGVGLATTREIPALEATGRHAEAARLQRRVFAWELIVGGLVGAGVLAGVLVRANRVGSAAYLAAWMALPAYAYSELIRNTLQSYLQSRREFARVRRAMITQAAADITVTVALAEVWGIAGAVAGMTLASLVVVAYLGWLSRDLGPYRPARLPWPALRGLIALGVPMLLQNVMWFNITNVDKLVILSFIDRQSLAYYSIAQTIAAVVLLVSASLAQVIGPLMIRRYAETSTAASLVGLVRRSVFILAYGLPVLPAIIWLVGPALFALVLPRYAAAVPLLDASSVAMYAIGITLGLWSLYVTLERQGLQVGLLAAAMSLSAGMGIVLIRLGWGVAGVAIGAVVASVLYMAAFVAIALRLLGRTGAEIVRDLGRTLLPVLLCATMVVILNIVPGGWGLSRIWLAVPAFLITVTVSGAGLRLALGPS